MTSPLSAQRPGAAFRKNRVDGETVEHTESSMTNDGLTDIEKAWIVGIDALLMHGSPQRHAVTDGRIVDFWGAGGVKF